MKNNAKQGLMAQMVNGCLKVSCRVIGRGRASGGRASGGRASGGRASGGRALALGDLLLLEGFLSPVHIVAHAELPPFDSCDPAKKQRNPWKQSHTLP